MRLFPMLLVMVLACDPAALKDSAAGTSTTGLSDSGLSSPDDSDSPVTDDSDSPAADDSDSPATDDTGLPDADGDGSPDADDCDDTNPEIHPLAEEICNGVDDNCDGLTDPDTATDAAVWYRDGDGDGFGTEGGSVTACAAPEGYVAGSGTSFDCADEDPGIHPGATETNCADPTDYNCDGSVGFADADGDGYAACEECDDGASGVYPGAAETCDGEDDDCDGAVDDDATDTITWYLDSDGDGYGDPGVVNVSCSLPSGYAASADDCDDGNSGVHPGAEEQCNGTDDDCDGAIDPEDASDAALWYIDADGDGFGVDDGSAVPGCTAPSGTASVAGDCDDADAAFHPGADEADCTDPNDYNCDGSVGRDDVDADGWVACEECDDRDAAIAPDAEERCDRVDNDCDGEVDEADDAVDPSTWYIDTDGDGYGDPDAATTESCAAPADHVGDSSDCDDLDGAINPAAAEVCDGVDNDCDSAVDDDDSALDLTSASAWFPDSDGDEHGADGTPRFACEDPGGYQLTHDDCDDGDAAFHPGAPESDCADPNDYNCDGSVGYSDVDEDGFAACDDCDDGEAAINPDASEVCDGVDNNCDGAIDDDDPSLDLSTALTWYVDRDADSFGAGPSAQSCLAPSGTAANADDCDDTEGGVHPDAVEVCDGIENDCDGLTDDDDPSLDGDTDTTWFDDTDLDGFGDPATGSASCAAPPGSTDIGADCDDADPAIHPDAIEVCDGIDNDCDGLADDADPDLDRSTVTTWYDDDDVDGFGDPATGTDACAAPAGSTDVAADCDDTDPAIHPDATEVCDAIDNDCDGLTDDDDSSLDLGTVTTWYDDADADGFGDPDDASDSCAAPTGSAEIADDCDDTDPTIHPDATEVCDEIDNDCDHLTDDDDLSLDPGTRTTWYDDADVDGFGDPDTGSDSCAAPAGSTDDGADCDDADAAVNPSGTESCNGDDDNCDGVVDESGANASSWYADNDGDGYGAGGALLACSAPARYVASSSDCDDSTSARNPGRSEVCGNGIDDDCSGSDATCPLTFTSCGGSGAMDVGQTFSCDLGSSRSVQSIYISVGCNDGETGSYRVSFDDGSSVAISGSCGSNTAISPRSTRYMSLYMASGGGGDQHISFTCCGSSGWGAYHR